MILDLLHRLASHGRVYDWIQNAVGAKRVYAAVASRIPGGSPNPVVLDIGGGTGALRRHLGFDCRYVCLDLEVPKLRAFRQKFPQGLALLGDATQLPLPDGSVDAAVCTAVAHHLPEEVFDNLLRESSRVLRPGGCLVFLDWIRPSRRIPSLILAALDRGAHPYSLARMRELIQCHFEIARSDRITIWHEYVLMVLRKPSVRGVC
jgi:ubiquinone/menaquinone biosynthesis C-methylase UbiE